MSLLGPIVEPNITCSSQFVDGSIRGLGTGAMWGLALAPLGIPADKMATEFTPRVVCRSVIQNSILFGSFLSIYTGFKKTNRILLI